MKKIGNEMMTKVTDIVKRAGENKSTIFTIGAGVGVVLTVITTAKYSVKVRKIFDDNDGRIGKDDIAEIVKSGIPVAVSIAGTLACIICAHKEDAAKYAALAALYASDSKKIDEYTKSIGGKKIELEKTNDVGSIATANPNSKKMRFYDEYCDRFIETSFEELLSATESVNDRLLEAVHGEAVSVEHFYKELKNCGAPRCLDDKTWDGSKSLMLIFELKSDENLQPYWSFEFNIDPE